MEFVKVKTFFVVSYTHQYGTDISCCATEALAYHEACNMISDWLSEINQHSSFDELVNLINDEKYKEAITLWKNIIVDLEIDEQIEVTSEQLISKLDRLVIDADEYKLFR